MKTMFMTNRGVAGGPMQTTQRQPAPQLPKEITDFAAILQNLSAEHGPQALAEASAQIMGNARQSEDEWQTLAMPKPSWAQPEAEARPARMQANNAGGDADEWVEAPMPPFPWNR